MKTCVITGAVAPGIGQAISDRLLKEGWAVIGTYSTKHEPEANSKSGQPNLKLYAVDHSNRHSLANFVDGIGSNK